MNQIKPKESFVWHTKSQDKDTVAALSKDLDILEVTARILVNRNLQTTKDAAEYMNPSTHNLNDPFLFKDMGRATKRIIDAIRDEERILICGDFDADGVTGTSVLYKALLNMEARVEYYIPDRLQEGYGMNMDEIDFANVNSCSLIITVDNGIVCHNEVDYSKKIGIDVIITDHHEPSEELPDAHSIINPKVKGESYPFKELSGVGVVCKLLEALDVDTSKYFDQVAIGTVADMVPLIEENRIFVHEGLKRINEDPSPGVEELISVSGIRNRVIDTRNIAFQLAPRINAAGRLKSGKLGVELFLAENKKDANGLALELDAINRNRQNIERKIVQDAESIIGSEVDENDEIIFLQSDDWHEGVIGIVASKLVEKYGKPVFIFARSNGDFKGSCRSANKVDIYNIICEASEYLDAFGGHKYAAGLTVSERNLPLFVEKIRNISNEILKGRVKSSEIIIDCEINFDEINTQLLSEIKQLAPFGCSNPEPVFMTSGTSLYGRVRLLGEKHIRFYSKKNGKKIPAIGFNMAHFKNLLENKGLVDIVYTPKITSYRGMEGIELELKSLKPSGGKAGEDVIRH